MSGRLSRAVSRRHQSNIDAGLSPVTGRAGRDATKTNPTPRAPQNRPAPHGHTPSGLPKRRAL